MPKGPAFLNNQQISNALQFKVQIENRKWALSVWAQFNWYAEPLDSSDKRNEITFFRSSNRLAFASRQKQYLGHLKFEQ